MGCADCNLAKHAKVWWRAIGVGRTWAGRDMMRLCMLCSRARATGAIAVQRERLAALAWRPVRAAEYFVPGTQSIAATHGCDRNLLDDVASAEECQRAAAAVQRALDVTGTVSMPLDVPAAEDLFGASGMALLNELRQRITHHVHQEVPEATVVGTLVTCIKGTAESGVGVESRDDAYTFASHIDKANRAAYDVTALLCASHTRPHLASEPDALSAP